MVRTLKRPTITRIKQLSIKQSGPYVQGPLKWAIAFTASLGAILEVIDTSIVNVALNDMQGNLGATVSEIGWVSTGYTIANVILIPLTAWLGDYFGRKRYFIFSLVGFTLSSILCGLSSSLTMLIVSRILQGLCGGGLLAKAQAILFETFPPAEQGVAQSVFGVGVIAGPAIGPTLGGYLTDNLGWRWIFFINVPFGILAVIMAVLFLPKDSSSARLKGSPEEAPARRIKGRYVGTGCPSPISPVSMRSTPTASTQERKLKNRTVDWLGITLLALAAGSLQTVLEQGQQDDWFASSLIRNLTIVGVISLGLFIWRELTTKYPAVDLRVLRHPSLAAGSLYSGLLGMGLYGALFAVPLFTQSVLNFTATQTGLLLAPGALASAIVMVLLGKISNKLDARILIAIGAVGTSWVMFQLVAITPQTGPDQLFLPLVERGAFSVLMFLPLSLATLAPLPRQDIAAGSGFYNLTRQLGGSVGIAILTTLLSRREFFHRARLVEHISIYNQQTNQRLDLLTGALQNRGMDPAVAHQQAIALIERSVDTQAAIMAYSDIFWVVGVVFLASLPLLLFLGKGSKGDKAVSVH